MLDRPVRRTDPRATGSIAWSLQAFPSGARWLDKVATAATPSRLIDIGFLWAASIAVLTEAVVISIHVMFVLIVAAALVLQLRPLAIRLTIWVLVATTLVAWDVWAHDTPATELAELPILTFVVMLVYLVARSRSLSHAALTESQRHVRDRLEAERDGLRSQLEQSQRLDVLGRASTRMAHDLRNILAIIKLCAADLTDHPEPQYRERGNEAMNAVDRGVDLLDELLTIGRTHHHRGDVIELGPTVSQAAPVLHHLVPPNVKLTVKVHDAGLTVRLSRTELMQVLMNLLTNAVDAISGPGTIRLDIRCVTRSTGRSLTKRTAMITVADDGPGIKPDALERLFVPGFTTKPDSHSGLGLATVWDIVARAGGTTEVSSSSAGGVVTVSLPLASDFVRRHALVDVEDTKTRSLLEDEFSALGFVVDPWVVDPDTSPPAAPRNRVVVSDGEATGDDADHADDAQVVDLTRMVGHEALPLNREEAAALVRRIITDTSRINSAAS